MLSRASVYIFPFVKSKQRFSGFKITIYDAERCAYNPCTFQNIPNLKVAFGTEIAAVLTTPTSGTLITLTYC